MNMDMDVYVYIGPSSGYNLPKGHMLSTRSVYSESLSLFLFLLRDASWFSHIEVSESGGTPQIIHAFSDVPWNQPSILEMPDLWKTPYMYMYIYIYTMYICFTTNSPLIHHSWSFSSRLSMKSTIHSYHFPWIFPIDVFIIPMFPSIFSMKSTIILEIPDLWNPL